MKNRKTNFIKLGILLFGISLFLFNCEKENEAFIPQTNFKYKIEKVTFPFYRNNTTLLKKVDEFNVTKRAIDKLQNKTENSDKKYTINTKEAIYIENNEGTHHTYTFEISNNNPLELQNIVLSLQDDGNYKAFLTTYQITKQERIDLYNGVSVDLSQRTSIKEININQVEYANKVGGGCYELEKVGEEWCNHTDHTVEAHILQGGYCNHPTSVYAWVEEPCPGEETGSGSPSVPLNGADGTLYNSGGNSSTDGGTITTSPVTLECDNCSNSLSLISYLNLTEQSQIDWANNTGNSLTVANLSNFGDANKWDENTTTISLQVLNALSNTTNSSLSFEENIAIKNKATEIFDIIANNNFSNIDQFSLVDQKTIAQNSLFISFLPEVNSIIGQYWPKNDEEWAVVNELIKQFLPELIIGFVPGSSALDVISGIDKGDATTVTLGIAGVLVDVFGGSIFKGIAKAGRVAYKAFKSFKIIHKFLKTIGKVLKTGLKTKLVDDTVQLTDNFDNIVATVKDDVVEIIAEKGLKLVDPSELKNLSKIDPTSSGYINSTKLRKAKRFKPSESGLKADFDNLKNLDNNQLGLQSEQLVNDLFKQDEYFPYDAKIPGFNGNNGFDGVYIKKDASGNVTDIIINEVKQVNNGAITLSAANTATGLPRQMTDDWITNVMTRMLQPNTSQSVKDLALLIRNNRTKITKVVTGIDKINNQILVFPIN